MAALAQRFKTDPTVAGYEIMNEPQSGSLAGPGVFEQGYLFPFYRRVIDALTGVRDGAACPVTSPAVAACGYPDLGIHDTHAFFFEPWALRNLLDVSVQASVPFSTYPNLVYAPHTYTHVFTAERQLHGAPVPYPTSYDQAFTTAEVEAKALGAALFIGEFGNGSDQDHTLLREATAAQDRHLTGSTVWEWKNTCGPADPCAGSWGIYGSSTSSPPAQNGPLKDSRVQFLSRVYPRATAGTLMSFSYDPITHAFAMTASSSQPVRPGPHAVETDVYVPRTVLGPVSVVGAAVLDRVVSNPDGSRDALVAPTGAGSYSVAVGPTN